MPPRNPIVFLGGAFLGSAVIGEIYHRVRVESRLQELTRLDGNRGYGLLAFVFILNNLFVRKLAFDVGFARRLPPKSENDNKPRRIEYPNLYAQPNDDISDEEAKQFNCVQRSHQHTLEESPEFLTLLGIAGVKYPVTTALFGLVSILGKYQYAAGYQTGNPSNRGNGRYVRYLGLIGGLLPLAIDSAVSFLLDRD